jgi:hypothetical protein
MRKWTMIYEETTNMQPLEIVQKQKETAVQGYSHNIILWLAPSLTTWKLSKLLEWDHSD